jgi:hypothetical protein
MRPMFRSGKRPTVELVVPHIQLYGFLGAFIIAELESREETANSHCIIDSKGRVWHSLPFSFVKDKTLKRVTRDKFEEAIDILRLTDAIYSILHEGESWIALRRSVIYRAEEDLLEAHGGTYDEAKALNALKAAMESV